MLLGVIALRVRRQARMGRGQKMTVHQQRRSQQVSQAHVPQRLVADLARAVGRAVPCLVRMRLKLQVATTDDVSDLVSLRTAVNQQLTSRYGKGYWIAGLTEKGVLFAMEPRRCTLPRFAIA